MKNKEQKIEHSYKLAKESHQWMET